MARERRTGGLRLGWSGTILVVLAALVAIALVLAARSDGSATDMAASPIVSTFPEGQTATAQPRATGQPELEAASTTATAATSSTLAPSSTTTTVAATTTAPAQLPGLGPPVSGLMYRTQEHVLDDQWAVVMGGGVVTVYWKDLEPKEGEFDLSTIRDAVATYHEVGITDLHLRVFGGVWSPDWLKEKVGSKRWVAENTVTVRHHRLPNMWTGEYAAGWGLLNEELAAEVGSAFVQVQVSGAGTVFAEPFIRQLSRKEPIAALTKWGITLGVDRALHREIFALTEAAWDGIAHRVLSVFPWQFLAGGEPQWNQMNPSFELVREFTELNPDLIVMANDLRAQPGATRRALHRRLSNEPNLLMFQTASDAVVGDLNRTLERGWGYGARAIELPSEFRTAGIEASLVSTCEWPDDVVPPC